MTNTVLLKRSGTANSVPLAANIAFGELAINYADGNLFYKNSGGTVTVIASNKTLSVTGNITGGNLLTSGLISATGNLTVGNITTTIANVTTFNSSQGGNVSGTLVSTSANAQFINQTNSAGNISAAGNILGSLNLSITGNVTGGNLLTSGIVSATGNITGKYFLGNANIQYTASTAPTTGNLIGAQWYNTSTDALYEWQTDGTSSYWVDITGPTFGTNGAVTGSSITNGTSNVSVGLSSDVTISVAGTPNVAVITSTGANVTGNLTVTYAPATAAGYGITVNAANTQGGTGYADFLKATNTSGGATNPDKTFRLNSTGGIEVINSGYSATLMSLSDAGALNISSSISIGGKKAVNGPAFRAYVDVGQTIVQGAQRKVTFGTENFDTDGCFASSTFTPTTEGYYQLNATVRISGTSGTGEVMIVLYKNGVEYARGINESGTEQGASFYSMSVSDIAYANGTTDNFEVYIQQSSGGDRTTTAGSAISHFSGVMVRGA